MQTVTGYRLFDVCPFAPLADRTFSVLTRKAEHYIEIVPTEENKYPIRSSRLMRESGLRPSGQQMLEVS